MLTTDEYEKGGATALRELVEAGATPSQVRAFLDALDADEPDEDTVEVDAEGRQVVNGRKGTLRGRANEFGVLVADRHGTALSAKRTRRTSAAMAMAESYLLDQKRILPAAAHLDGQYGHKDMFLGVPVVLGAAGVERILELELTEEEKGMLAKSASSVKAVLDVAAKM